MLWQKALRQIHRPAPDSAVSAQLLALRLRSMNGVADGWVVVSIVGKGAKIRTIAARPAELHSAILETFRPEKASDFLFKNTHRKPSGRK